MTDHGDTSPAGSLPRLSQADAPVLPSHLEKLADRARDYIEAASSANTRRAYASDWKHFAAWCRRQNLGTLPPDPQIVGLYITAQASGAASLSRKPNAVSTIERRLSSLSWTYAQRGAPLDRTDRHIATVLAGIRNWGRPNSRVISRQIDQSIDRVAAECVSARSVQDHALSFWGDLSDGDDPAVTIKSALDAG